VKGATRERFEHLCAEGREGPVVVADAKRHRMGAAALMKAAGVRCVGMRRIVDEQDRPCKVMVYELEDGFQLLAGYRLAVPPPDPDPNAAPEPQPSLRKWMPDVRSLLFRLSLALNPKLPEHRYCMLWEPACDRSMRQRLRNLRSLFRSIHRRWIVSRLPADVPEETLQTFWEMLIQAADGPLICDSRAAYAEAVVRNMEAARAAVIGAETLEAAGREIVIETWRVHTGHLVRCGYPVVDPVHIGKRRRRRMNAAEREARRASESPRPEVAEADAPQAAPVEERP